MNVSYYTIAQIRKQPFVKKKKKSWILAPSNWIPDIDSSQHINDSECFALTQLKGTTP